MIELGLWDYLKQQPQITRLVKRNIFLSRRPQVSGRKGPAITIERFASIRHYPLTGEADVATATIRLEVWAKGDNAEQIVFRVFEEVRLLISSFRGYWGKHEVLGCTYQTESYDAESSPDGSDQWDFSYSCDLRINYRQEPTFLSPPNPVFVGRVLRLANGRVLRLSTARLHQMNQSTITSPQVESAWLSKLETAAK